MANNLGAMERRSAGNAAQPVQAAPTEAKTEQPAEAPKQEGGSPEQVAQATVQNMGKLQEMLAGSQPKLAEQVGGFLQQFVGMLQGGAPQPQSPQVGDGMGRQPVNAGPGAERAL